MNYSLISVRYAKALFSFGQEKDKIDTFKKDVDLVSTVFSESKELINYLTFPIIKPTTKIKILERLFKEKIDIDTFNFLVMVIKNKREEHLQDILRGFVKIFRKYRNIETTTLTTAIPLDKKEREDVIKSIETAFNTIVELNEKVNPDIIGGLIVQIEDSQLDLSVAKKLQRLEERLLNHDLNSKH